MTVLEDRIEMADECDELTLDGLFESLERITPEGYKVEIVEGAIFMSPQRDTHWEIILDIVEQLRAKYPRNRVKSDVRVDYPGHLNGFASDVTLVKEDAEKDAKGLWNCKDVEFVAEVISKGTAHNDYGPKKTAYARADIPVYLIVDPYQGKSHLYTQPKDGKYLTETSVAFGTDVDAATTPLGLTLKTDEFPRD
ncbi:MULTISPECIES: Uma2 family endonuclease [Streptomyces]|uniref:Uma2 family endonuclease n=1 Tax=Streptomyces fuscus TaxID=3048495 RepID=A0ABT7J8L5_9ACTN|nr:MULTISPECIES: Uma2 family endonuclease [Streptomyces]MCM1969834.1 Uma2 family endonuclease [Streptomyces sp. G1]MDL2080639.1 Uma2 family endonuclease [Streptomyces fuscus]SBT95320.1 Endonuclease, Uma2 family (restriction endonuclease fold) [Streptomyces sp. DI166]